MPQNNQKEGFKLPTKIAAYKALRKSRKKHARNLSVKSELKSIIKKLEKMISDKKIDDAKKLLPKVAAILNRAASKNIIHKNTASRKISRLSKRISSASKKA